MLTYADVFRRMLTYADAFRRIPTYADVALRYYRRLLQVLSLLALLVQKYEY
jgi:hypothetical protein